MKKPFIDFSHKQTFLGAVGFYFLWVILLFIFSLLVGYVIGRNFSIELSQKYGSMAGRIIAIGSPLLFSYLVLRSKKLLKNLPLVLVGLASGLIATFMGLLIAFIPVAFLTTRGDTPKKNARKKK